MTLLSELEDLTHSARMRRMAEAGKKGEPVAELELGDFYERLLALQSVYGSRRCDMVEKALADPSVACHRQGVETLFLGATGRDAFRDEVLRFAQEEGLRVELQLLEEHSTGAASIVVDEDAENLIVVALGASAHLSPEFVSGFADEIRASQVVVCQAECNLEAVRRAFELARSAGVITVWNPAPINSGISPELLRLADVAGQLPVHRLPETFDIVRLLMGDDRPLQ